VTTLLVAAVLARTVVKGERVPLILELPPYRLPKASTVLRMIWDRSRLFLTEAGTVILACTVVLWALLSFPRNDAALDGVKTSHLTLGAGAEVSEAQAAGGDAAAKEAAAAAVRLRESFGGRLGRVIEPAIEPLGFDWKIGIGLVGAFAAREVFVATLGVVYGAGAGVDEQSDSLRERIRAERKPDGTPRYTPLVGVSLLVFFALSAQCMSTLAAVRRETRSWRWPLFLFSYMTALAWLASFVVYQGGRVLGLG
jgi:ferrous iron transport protein B